MRTWLAEHQPWLLGVIDYPGYRLFGDCWAEDCPIPSGRNIRHSPQQFHRCEGTSMAIELTEGGWLASQGIDPNPLGAVIEPVVPVSRAEPA